MFAIVQNGQIIMFITSGSPWEYQGIQYPPQWIAQATPEQKAEMGIVDVVYGQQANQQYYWVTQDVPVYNAQTNQVDINFTSTPKNLTQVKGNAISQVDQTAYSLLQPNDWMVIKATETSTPINPDWNSWRASVRATADQTKTSITAAADVDAVATIMSNIAWPKSPATVAAEAAQISDDISEEAK